MIVKVRQQFNKQFSVQKYDAFLNDLNETYHYTIPFRVAETPVFVDKHFARKLFASADHIIDFIVRPDFREQMAGALPDHLRVPHETPNSLFIALDYAVCTEGSYELVPRLIEMQGFPSLFGYQDFLGAKIREHYSLPDSLHYHFGLDSEAYWKKLRNAIVGKHNPEEVVLLEIDPLKQNTAIDFLITREKLGITLLHLGDVRVRGRALYYMKGGKEIRIQRIYNRVIFDELVQRKDLVTEFHLTEDVDVEWAGHPNWFFYISKYTMPFLHDPAVPESRFLHTVDQLPADLENYVLKPLFSFSGSGVIFHVTRQDIDRIPMADRKNFMLQKKVHYEPVVQAPDGLVKAEIRLLYLWEPGSGRPTLLTNLARLSRGEMIGVKYNKDKTWVGGTVCFFES
ncbi:MAG: hypothetical protein U0289_02745 [Cyclobacteriaceae bacterium]|nr:hypothetical protein [Cytophagales bacterium]HNP77068.1 hypothetical protein [Cyclobacteriaceae bacterium]